MTSDSPRPASQETGADLRARLRRLAYDIGTVGGLIAERSMSRGLTIEETRQVEMLERWRSELFVAITGLDAAIAAQPPRSEDVQKEQEPVSRRDGLRTGERQDPHVNPNEPASASLDRLRAFVREKQSGACRAMSCGFDCPCLLCDADRVERHLDVLREDLSVTERLLTERQRVLDAIPSCEQHGPCVPHALEWVEAMKRLPGSKR